MKSPGRLTHGGGQIWGWGVGVAAELWRGDCYAADCLTSIVPLATPCSCCPEPSVWARGLRPPGTALLRADWNSPAGPTTCTLAHSLPVTKDASNSVYLCLPVLSCVYLCLPVSACFLSDSSGSCSALQGQPEVGLCSASGGTVFCLRWDCVLPHV